MTIAVIGANGKSGKAFIEIALQAGHSIITGSRHSNTDSRITHKYVDATNPDHVYELIKDADAIVSLIGHNRSSSSTLLTDATQAVIDAMQSLPPKPYISLTGTGVRMPGDTITLLDRIFTAGITLFDKKRITDSSQALQLLQRSPIPWIIIRVVKLTNQSRNSYTLSEHGPAKTFVPRDTVALAILDCLTQPAVFNKVLTISN